MFFRFIKRFSSDRKLTKMSACKKCKKALDCLIILMLIICAVLTAIIIIIQFVIGIVYNGQCPIQPLVPIYNIVAGSTGIAIMIMSLLFAVTYQLHKCKPILVLVPPTILLSLLVLFQIVWGIVGGYYTLPLRTNNATQYDTPNLPTYCHPTLFWITFVILVVFYIALAIAGINACSLFSSTE